MELDRLSPASGGLGHDIPARGLSEVLRAWSGAGELWEALAAVDSTISRRRWSARDIERRAHRVLFPTLTSDLQALPTSVQEWIEALPAESIRFREIDGRPLPNTSWTETRLRGWPPTRFVGHVRARVADTLLVTCTKWTLDRLKTIYRDAIRVEPGLGKLVPDQMSALMAALSEEPLVSAESIRPSHTDVEALSREGWPWSVVANLSDRLREITDVSLFELAQQVVVPTPELRWRLFHLGVLGELLIAIKEAGGRIISMRPLSATAARPSYVIRDATGHTWDLWFEAAGIWNYYGVQSPYIGVTSGVIGENRPLGADILLIRKGKAALIVECKYSLNPVVVARAGYYQAVCYATEIHSRLAPEVSSVVVGPGKVVPSPTRVELNVGAIAVGSPSYLSEVVCSFLDEQKACRVSG